MTIRQSTQEDAGQLANLIDEVARERRFLAATKGFSAESTESFIESLRTSNGIQLIALADKGIVGWCDISPYPYEGMAHVGKLGMGVALEFRQKGIGKRLLSDSVFKAFELGYERIELEVFSNNIGAVSLYKSLGFVYEGKKTGIRKLDGIIDDILLFAKFKE
jgi:RimJ/RimL family protein N-acetyltransferase